MSETEEAAAVVDVVDGGVPISRKRTRDDVEPEIEEEAMKRRKEEDEDEDEDEESESKQEEEKTEVEEETGANSEESTKEDGEPAKAEAKESAEEKVANVKEVTEDKEVKDEAKDEVKDEVKETKDTKPKFVFGSTTPFGANAFSMLNKPNVFATETKASTTSVFGSSSTFQNAFQNAINKESIFDKKEEKEKEEDKEEDKDKELYKQVDLEKQNIKSGEENEQQIFTCRSKLYILDLTDVKSGWKERGVGNIHVNKNDLGKSRIIMRSIGLLKVILNTSLVPGLEIVKGMPSSLSSEKFIRITSVENGKPIQFALKTGNIETRDKLYDSVKNLLN